MHTEQSISEFPSALKSFVKALGGNPDFIEALRFGKHAAFLVKIKKGGLTKISEIGVASFIRHFCTASEGDDFNYRPPFVKVVMRKVWPSLNQPENYFKNV